MIKEIPLVRYLFFAFWRIWARKKWRREMRCKISPASKGTGEMTFRESLFKAVLQGDAAVEDQVLR